MIEKTRKTYSENEVILASTQYFNGDDMAGDVWAKKYALKDENTYYELTPDDMHWRLASELARIENKYPNPLSKEEIYETLKNFKRIVPQGSPMSGIGNKNQIVSLSNCFVVGNDKDSDSYGGIMKLDQETVQLQKRRGGVGLDVSFVRPKGSPVKNSAITSTGVVPFMERFSNSTKEVAQDGRRGALMLSISIRHPDSEDFIDAKTIDGKVTGANVSVKLEDDFIKSSIEGKPYIQCYPISLLDNWDDKEVDFNLNDFKENGEFDKLGIVNDRNGKFLGYVKKIDSKRLWDKIIHNAWKSAEPGILFWDRIINESVPDSYNDLGFKTVSTNPCFPASERLLTENGYFKFGDLATTDHSKTNRIVCDKRISYEDNGEEKPENWKIDNSKFGTIVRDASHVFQTQENAEVMEVTTLMGFRVRATPDHHIATTIGMVETKDLTQEHEILIATPENNDSIVNKNPTSSELKAYWEGYLTGVVYESILNNSRNNIGKYFLRGVVENLGEIIENGTKIRIVSHDEKYLQNIQLIAHSNGILMSLIESENKDKYELTTINDSIYDYVNTIGFNNDSKKLEKVKLNSNQIARKSFTDKVVSIKKLDNEPVYCLKEDIGRNLIVNGISARRCGEIPLCPYDSCRLLALNLFGYVVNPFTNDSYFDWELFKSDVQIAMRYMDDIVDLEIEKINGILDKIDSDPEDEFIKLYEKNLWERIKEMAQRGRRTGLGITAEGDMLAALGYRYGTEEATDFSVEVHKQLKLSAYRSSVTMAKERGAFEVYDNEKEKNNPFINRVKEEDIELYNDMVKYGRRNIALLTIAPTGSLSILTQTTSGIEPVFLPVYKRRRKINPQEKNVKIDFVDAEGIAWTEYTVFHHKFKKWLEINGYDIDVINTMSSEQLEEIVKKSPYYKATSNDVDWIEKVKMQGRVQEHVDHSISVTVNLPKDVSEGLVENVYKTAWEYGCKGITVYRDGSRDGVLISNNDKQNTLIDENGDNNAPKRPKRLKADVHRFQNNLEKWIAVVGIKNNRPFEIFTGKYENGLSNLPQNVTECEVVRNIIEVEENGEIVKKKRYDIEYVDSDGNKQIHRGVNHAFNSEFWNYAKFVSALLRHRMPLVNVYELINKLNFKEEHINTWKNGVARTIKKYIKDGETGKGVCPECGADNLQYVEGCLVCRNCGYGQCG